MSKTQTPAEIAVSFIEAFGRKDLATVEGLLAENVTFESPRVTVRGAGPVLEVVRQFAQVVTDVNVISALGNHAEAMIMYDMRTAPFGIMRAVDRLVVQDGTIVADTLVFDTYEIRRAEQG